MQAEIQTFTIRLPKPVRVDAERLAAEEQRPLGNLLRRLIVEGLERRRAAQPAQKGQ